jgi:hypothetical protein
VKLLEGQVATGGGSCEVDMEAQFLSLGLDIIGLGVFNYEFGSITTESPVIKVRGEHGCKGGPSPLSPPSSRSGGSTVVRGVHHH